jgi:hypothetical protein
MLTVRFQARRVHSISTATDSHAAVVDTRRRATRLWPNALKASAISQTFSGGLVL